MLAGKNFQVLTEADDAELTVWMFDLPIIALLVPRPRPVASILVFWMPLAQRGFAVASRPAEEARPDL